MNFEGKRRALKEAIWEWLVYHPPEGAMKEEYLGELSPRQRYEVIPLSKENMKIATARLDGFNARFAPIRYGGITPFEEYRKLKTNMERVRWKRR